MSCGDCSGASMAVLSVGGVPVAGSVAVLGDDVHRQRARQTAAAMCEVCRHAVRGSVRRRVAVDVWRVRSGVVGCLRRGGGAAGVDASGVAAAVLVECPDGVWTLRRWARVVWRGRTWVGVPWRVRVRLWLRGVRPRGGAWSGCGCSAVLRLIWWRCVRFWRSPSPLWRGNAYQTVVREGGV